MFKELRKANISRDKIWAGADGIDLEFRINEIIGEVGELANGYKKYHRNKTGIAGNVNNDVNIAEVFNNIKEEIGDVAICCDLLAMDLGIDLNSSLIQLPDSTRFKIVENKSVFRLIRSVNRQLAQMEPDHPVQTLKSYLEDGLCRLDLLAWKLGVEMAEATEEKFNKTSVKHNMPIRMKIKEKT